MTLFGFFVMTSFLTTLSLRAQNPVPEEKPQPLPPKSRTPAEVQRQEAEKIAREARKLFALGAILQHQDRLLEAIRKLEECLKLDPDAVAPRKTLAELYVIVGRIPDALACVRRVVDLAPQDPDGWQRLADISQNQGMSKEAIAALLKKLDCPSLEKEPELFVLTLKQLAALQDNVGDFKAAEATLTRYLQALEKHREEFQKTDFLSADEYRHLRAEALERVGQAYAKSQRLADAKQAFAQAYKIYQERPDDPLEVAHAARLHFRLAEALAAANEPAPALEHLQYYLKLRPASAEPYQFLIRLLKQMGRDREIALSLEHYWQQDKPNVNLQLLLADQYAAEHRDGQAKEHYFKLIEQQPKVEYYRGLYKLFASEHNPRAALEQLDKYMAVLEDEKKPEEERANAGRHAKAIMSALRENTQLVTALLPLAMDELQMKQRKSLRYGTFHQLANLAAFVDDLDVAAAFYREGLSNVGGRGRRAVSADFYMRIGLLEILETQHKWNEVCAVCQEVIDRRENGQPGVDAFWFRHSKSLALAKLGKFDEAMAEAEQAIQDGLGDSSMFYLRSGKVSILLQSDKTKQALEECNKMSTEFAKTPDYRKVQLLLASIYSTMREHDKAEQILRGILENDPNDAQANNDLGYQLAEQNRNLDEAERLIRRAIELDRNEKSRPYHVADNPAYLDSFGWVLFRRGRPEEARTFLEKAVQLPGGREDPAVWNHLGDVFFRLGDNTKAHEAWWKAREWMKKEDFRSRTDGRLEELERKMRLTIGK
jgi:tetratricopeptide (TPR) repeat protein